MDQKNIAHFNGSLSAFNSSCDMCSTTSLTPLENRTLFPNNATVVHEPETLAKYLYYNVCPALVPIGLIGNSFSFAVLIKLSKFSSFYLYLSVLALSDLGFVISSSTVKWLHPLGFYQINNSAMSFMCSLNVILNFIFAQFSTWITVAVTVDRYIAVCHPFKVARYTSKRRTILYMIACFLFITCANIPGVCIKREIGTDFCSFTEVVDDPCFKYAIKVDTVLYFIVPIVLLIVFNIMIIHGLYKSAILSETLTSRLDENTGKSRAVHVNATTKRTTFVLFLITVVYFVTSLARAFGAFLILQRDEGSSQDNYTLHIIIYTTTSLNHSINFLLYGISAKEFRQTVIQMACQCRLTDRKRQAVTKKEPGKTNSNSF